MTLNEWQQVCQSTKYILTSVPYVRNVLAPSINMYYSAQSWQPCHQKKSENFGTKLGRNAKFASLLHINLIRAHSPGLPAKLLLAQDPQKVKSVEGNTTLSSIRIQNPRARARDHPNNLKLTMVMALLAQVQTKEHRSN